MIIANPIYDVVFKRMMENERVAKFFIETLLEEEIASLEFKPQELTYESKESKEARFAIFRLDFIVTIKTEKGEYKKILIEIQKANSKFDIMRFRNYLASQYSKEDVINNKKTTLPITTIYILGFKLPEIDAACIKVERNYKDLVNKKIIDTKSEFVEKLTHDSFIVQVDRITDRYQTRLDKLLSVFEQRNFAGDEKITKSFSHPTDIEEVRIITDILHYVGTEPKERKELEIEQEAWRTLNVQREDLIEKLEEKDKILQANAKVIEENAKVLEEKDKENAKLQKQLEELKRKLNENK